MVPRREEIHKQSQLTLNSLYNYCYCVACVQLIGCVLSFVGAKHTTLKDISQYCNVGAKHTILRDTSQYCNEAL